MSRKYNNELFEFDNDTSETLAPAGEFVDIKIKERKNHLNEYLFGTGNVKTPSFEMKIDKQ